MNERKLYLIWRNPVSRAQYRIAELTLDGKRYRFQYDGERLQIAEAGGFDLMTSPLYPSLPDVNRIYESDEMPSVFANRLPDRSRVDYADLLADKGLPPAADAFDVLRVTRGRLATDQLFFDEAPQRISQGEERFTCYIAGWRYYGGEGEGSVERLRIGAPVHLVPEQSNPFDPSAVIAISHEGYKLGYLPAFHSELVSGAFPEGRPVEAAIVQVNPAPAPPDERARIEVKIGPPGGRVLSGEEVESRARAKFRAGLLPRQLPRALRRAGFDGASSIIIGGGKGKVCSLCDRVIGGTHELATEFRYRDQRKMVFHNDCFETWDRLRWTVADEQRPQGESAGAMMTRKKEEVMVVFVASPSDLEAERNRLEEVVHELNVAWSRTLSVRLDLVRWETHGHPGIGEDAQAVLNQQLPNDYRVFIGMMWGRYGTPTGRAGSGTEEEFRDALARFRRSPESVRIMFYFKDAPLAPSRVNTAELAKIQEFRASLDPEGVLYWTFESLEEFERLIRLHLTREIQELLRSEQREDADGSAAEETEVEASDEEEGFLDVLDSVETYSAGLLQTVGRITAETTALGGRIESRTREMNDLRSRSGGQISRSDMRAILESASIDMNQYVSRIRSELPLFRENLERGVDAVARVALIAAEIRPPSDDHTRQARSALEQLSESLGGALESTGRFRDAVQALPRMTVVLNRAKRETVDVLEEILGVLAGGHRVVAEAGRTLDAVIDHKAAGDVN